MGNLDKHGKPWSAAEETLLRELVFAGVSKDYIAARLGPSPTPSPTNSLT
jgi:hypothetical protein